MMPGNSCKSATIYRPGMIYRAGRENNEMHEQDTEMNVLSCGQDGPAAKKG